MKKWFGFLPEFLQPNDDCVNSKIRDTPSQLDFSKKQEMHRQRRQRVKQNGIRSAYGEQSELNEEFDQHTMMLPKTLPTKLISAFTKGDRQQVCTLLSQFESPEEKHIYILHLERVHSMEREVRDLTLKVATLTQSINRSQKPESQDRLSIDNNIKVDYFNILLNIHLGDFQAAHNLAAKVMTENQQQVVKKVIQDAYCLARIKLMFNCSSKFQQSPRINIDDRFINPDTVNLLNKVYNSVSSPDTETIIKCLNMLINQSTDSQISRELDKIDNATARVALQGVKYTIATLKKDLAAFGIVVNDSLFDRLTWSQIRPKLQGAQQSTKSTLMRMHQQVQKIKALKKGEEVYVKRQAADFIRDCPHCRIYERNEQNILSLIRKANVFTLSNSPHQTEKPILWIIKTLETTFSLFDTFFQQADDILAENFDNIDYTQYPHSYYTCEPTKCALLRWILKQLKIKVTENKGKNLMSMEEFREKCALLQRQKDQLSTSLRKSNTALEQIGRCLEPFIYSMRLDKFNENKLPPYRKCNQEFSGLSECQASLQSYYLKKEWTKIINYVFETCEVFQKVCQQREELFKDHQRISRSQNSLSSQSTDSQRRQQQLQTQIWILKQTEATKQVELQRMTTENQRLIGLDQQKSQEIIGLRSQLQNQIWLLKKTEATKQVECQRVKIENQRLVRLDQQKSQEILALKCELQNRQDTLKSIDTLLSNYDSHLEIRMDYNVNERWEKLIEMMESIQRSRNVNAAVQSENIALTFRLSQTEKQCQQLEEQKQKEFTQQRKVQTVDTLVEREQLFLGSDIINSLKDQEFLTKSIHEIIGRSPHSAHIIYRMDTKSSDNPHLTIDNKPNLLLVIKTTKQQIIGAFLTNPFSRDEKTESEYDGREFMFSLTNREVYPSKTGKQIRKYDSKYIIVGNSDLRIDIAKRTLHSGFGSQKGHFDFCGKNVTDFLKENNNARQIGIQTYEIYQIQFNAKEVKEENIVIAGLDEIQNTSPFNYLIQKRDDIVQLQPQELQSAYKNVRRQESQDQIRVELKAELSKREQQLNQKKDQVRSLRDQLTLVRAEVTQKKQLERRIITLNHRIAQLEQLEQRSKHNIEKLDQQIRSQTLQNSRKLSEQRQKVTERDTIVDQLREQLRQTPKSKERELQTTVSTLTQQIQDLSRQIHRLQTQKDMTQKNVRNVMKEELELVKQKLRVKQEQQKCQLQEKSRLLGLVNELTLLKERLEMELKASTEQLEQKNSEIAIKEIAIKNIENEQKQSKQKLKREVQGMRENNVRNIDKFFVGDIMDFQQENKKWLVELLEKEMGRTIFRTKLLYKFDRISKVNFHKYFDNHPNLLIIIKTSTGKLIGAFSSEACVPGKDSTGPGFIYSMSQRKLYGPNRKNKFYRTIIYDGQHLIFGNSELRLKALDNKAFSNFAIINNFFETHGQNVDALLGEGERTREVKLQTYEIFEVVFEV